MINEILKIWQDTTGGQTKKSKNSSPEQHQCSYCGKSFVRATTLAAHNCEPQRRHRQRDEVGVRLGFTCFQKFYHIINPTAAVKTYEQFVDSPYYLAFVKFGRYLVEIRAVAPERYCDWLLRNNKKLDHWCRDQLYEEYLLEYLIQEPAAPALERSIETMTQWAEENSARYQDYFKYATVSRVCFDVQRGRVSPWAIYCSHTGKQFLNNLSEADLESIWAYIDSDRWTKNFDLKEHDFQWAESLFEQAGI